MSNHFHLLLEIPEPNLVNGMRYLMGTFSQGWNARHQRRGHVFQGRYKSIPVAGERAADGSYFSFTADYIHLNPARARLLGSEPLTFYAWSSLPVYEIGKGPKWLVMERMLEAFHLHLRHRRRKAYVAYLQRRVEENGGDLSDEAMRKLRKDWYLVSDGFRDQLVNQINAVAGKMIKKGSVSGPVVKAHKEADAEHVIQLLGAEIEYDVNRESLAPQRKGIWQKALLAAMVKKHCTMSNQWMAKRLEMGHHAGISKVVKLYQVCKEGIKQMKKYKKYLNPRTDPI